MLWQISAAEVIFSANVVAGAYGVFILFIL